MNDKMGKNIKLILRRLLIIAGIALLVSIFAIFLISSVRYGPIGLLYKVIPCNSLLEKEKEANLGEEFTLRKCETVHIKDTDVSLKVTGFIYSPCPPHVVCVWSGLAVNYMFKVGDKSYANSYDKTPYNVIMKKSDYKTYATFVIDKAESTCNKAIQYSQDAQDSCWKGLAYRFDNQSYCNKISNLSTKDKCVEDLVEKLNKNELCDEVVSPKRYCQYLKLTKQNNLVECDTIWIYHWRVRCYKDIAEKSGEGIQICDTLTPEKAKICREAITGPDY